MYGPNSSPTVYHGNVPFETDLCSLLQKMNIENSTRDPARYANSVLATRSCLPGLNGQDDLMDDVNYQSDGGSDCSSSSSGSSNCASIDGVISHNGNGMLSLPNDAATGSYRPAVEGEAHGCAYLQTIRSQFDNNPTIGGEYLEAIFTHREILNTFPIAHRECARVFTDLAYLIEQRAWSLGQSADTDAVTAFRHEAWMIASTL